MSATLKFTDYLNNKKKLNAPTTLPIGNEPVMSTGEIGNVTMPKYTDALNGTKQQLPAGIQAVQLTEETPKYSDAIKPIVPTPGYVEDPNAKPSNPVTTTTEPLSFEEYVLSLKSKADDQYKRDILNAQNTYDQSKSAYGTKAASLSNMGLTGSGYSDYLDSRAYGQMQAHKNAAIRTRDETKLAADTRYMDYLNQQDSARKNAYTGLLGNITYNTSDADIMNLGKAYGLSDDEINTLKQTRLDRVKAYLDSNEYDKTTLDTLFPNKGAEYDVYYNKMKDRFGEFDETWIYDTDGLIPKQSAMEKIDTMKAAGFSDAEIAAAKEKVEAAYSISNGGGITFKKDNAMDNVPGDNAGHLGNNITLTDADGNKYRVEYDGTEGNEAVKTAAKNRGLKENDVFMYDNKVYIIIGGKYYGLRKRSNSAGAWTGSWNSLVNKLKETTKSSEE